MRAAELRCEILVELIGQALLLDPIPIMQSVPVYLGRYILGAGRVIPIGIDRWKEVPLSGGERVIPGLVERALHGRQFRQDRSLHELVVIHSERAGILSGDHRGPRGTANAVLAVGPVKTHPPGRQKIQGWRVGIWVARIARHARMMLIREEQQDIGPFGRDAAFGEKPMPGKQ